MGLWSKHSVHMGLNSITEDKVAEFKKLVEEYGEAEASWGCTGRTLHYTLASQLASRLPEYDFDISYDHYKCVARKKSA